MGIPSDDLDELEVSWNHHIVYRRPLVGKVLPYIKINMKTDRNPGEICSMQNNNPSPSPRGQDVVALSGQESSEEDEGPKEKVERRNDKFWHDYSNPLENRVAEASDSNSDGYSDSSFYDCSEESSDERSMEIVLKALKKMKVNKKKMKMKKRVYYVDNLRDVHLKSLDISTYLLIISTNLLQRTFLFSH
jgi:hypothetical protein